MHGTLLKVAKIVSTLTLFYADAILPCTRFSNPTWEVIRGTNRGSLHHQKL